MSDDNKAARVVFQSAERNIQVTIVGADPAKGDKGKTVISIDNNKNTGPTSTGTNIMIGSTGKGLDVPGVGTLAVNFYRAPQGAVELEAVAAQMKRAEQAKLLAKQIADLRASAAKAV